MSFCFFLSEWWHVDFVVVWFKWQFNSRFYLTEITVVDSNVMHSNFIKLVGLKHQEENQTRHFEITAVFLFIYFLKINSYGE